MSHRQPKYGNSSLIRTLAPSGNPILFSDLVNCASHFGRVRTGELKSLIGASLGITDAFLFSTGRAAMTVLLGCIASRRPKRDKDIVVVPSYTCYSVPASALKAGLRVLVCDIDSSTLTYDEEQLESIDFERVLAIVSSNLYGIPNDLSKLESLARQHDVHLIDDAAQCLGAKFQNRAVGSFGDAGILSFDKGKVVTTINGGVIVTNNADIALNLKKEHNRLRKQTGTKRAVETVKLLAYSLFLRPALYWIPGHLPFLRLGETRFDDTYPVERYFDRLAPIAERQLSRLETINEHRSRCAARYSAALTNLETVELIRPLPASEPIYLRYPIRILDQEMRRQFLQTNRKLGCSVSYPAAIADIPEIRGQVLVQNGVCDSGRKVAAQLVTLPTHAYVRETDIAQICDGLAR